MGVKTFSGGDQFLRGSFPEYDFVPGMVLVEAMAQCGGAGIKKLELGSGMFGFAGIENASFYRGVQFGKEFRMVIRNIRISDRYFKQSGIGYVDGEVCIEAGWTCIKIQ